MVKLFRSRAALSMALVLCFSLLALIPADVFSADASFSRSASPNTNVEGFYIPDDFFLHEQWSLFNFGQPVGGRVTGTKDADIYAPEAWSITRGSPDVIVAVLDSGIDYDHPDLEPNIWTNPGETGGGKESNGIDDDGNGYVDDWRGWDFADGDNDASDGRAGSIIDNSDPMAHGTAVASVIAAAGDNETGMTGVAPEVRILQLRIIGSGIDDADSAEAAAYAVETGARVVNLSFGTFVPGFGGFPKLSEVIAASPDVLFIAAAGNSGNDSELMRTEPCVLPHPNIVCVAATDQDDNLADFASGGSNFSGAVVDIGAPGANMLVAQPPYEVVFSEDFETPLEGRWETGGDKNTWGLSDSVASSGTSSLSDSPDGDYEAGEARWARMTEPVDLTGKSDCLLEFYVRADLGNADLLALETSSNGSSWSLRVGANGFSMVGSTDSEFERRSVLLTLEAGKEAYFGFRLRDLPNTPSGDGIYIDDMTITCQSSTYDDRQFAYAEGTSFATPLVSGVAALLLSDQPDLSADQVKQALLDSADPAPALEGKTISGGRVNAYKALLEARSIASGSATPDRPAAFYSSAADASAPAGGFVDNMILPIIKMLVPSGRGGDVPSGNEGGGGSETGGPGEAGGEVGAGNPGGSASEPGEGDNTDAVSPPGALPRGEAAEIAPSAPPGSSSNGPGGIPWWLWTALGGTVAAGTAAYTTYRIKRKLQEAAVTVDAATTAAGIATDIATNIAVDNARGKAVEAIDDTRAALEPVTDEETLRRLDELRQTLMTGLEDVNPGGVREKWEQFGDHNEATQAYQEAINAQDRAISEAVKQKDRNWVDTRERIVNNASEIQRLRETRDWLKEQVADNPRLVAKRQEALNAIDRRISELAADNYDAMRDFRSKSDVLDAAVKQVELEANHAKSTLEQSEKALGSKPDTPVEKAVTNLETSKKAPRSLTKFAGKAAREYLPVISTVDDAYTLLADPNADDLDRWLAGAGLTGDAIEAVGVVVAGTGAVPAGGITILVGSGISTLSGTVQLGKYLVDEGPVILEDISNWAEANRNPAMQEFDYILFPGLNPNLT